MCEHVGQPATTEAQRLAGVYALNRTLKQQMATLSNPFVMSKEQKKKKLRVGVAIDGSGVSEKALLLGGRLLHPDRCDRLYILHISDPNKPWLPDTLTPDHLEHEYQLKCHEQQVTEQHRC